jgi:hypothetical protein
LDQIVPVTLYAQAPWKSMNDLTDLLISLFKSREAVTTDGGDARALVALQSGLYNQIAKAFEDVPYASKKGNGVVGRSPLAATVFDNATAIIGSNPPQITEDSGRHIVTGMLPILFDSEVQRIRSFVRDTKISGRTLEEAKLYALMAAGALLAEAVGATKSPLLRGEELTHVDSTALLAQLAAYSARKATLQNRTEIVSDYEERIAHIIAGLDNYRAEFEKERLDQRHQLDVLNASAIEIDNRSNKALDAIVQFESKLAGTTKSISERWKLNQARLNWNRRYREARTGFMISIVILAGFLCSTIVTAIFFAPAIISSINDLDMLPLEGGDSASIALAHQISRIIVFTVPFIVYFWMIKASMRFFMRSMLLMDDARQRETMLDTYFLLTEEGKADEQDRPLILWALFRQTPGHGPDGIEPPDFTQVINAGLMRSKGPLNLA